MCRVPCAAFELSICEELHITVSKRKSNDFFPVATKFILDFRQKNDPSFHLIEAKGKPVYRRFCFCCFFCQFSAFFYCSFIHGSFLNSFAGEKIPCKCLNRPHKTSYCFSHEENLDFRESSYQKLIEIWHSMKFE